MSCVYERDEALSTTRLTQQYCAEHGLPRLDSNWTLIDMVASSKPGTGALLLLSAIVTAARQKRTGLCSIAVTKGGRRLFASFGFETNHGWREKGGQRYLCHARLADLRLADLHRRLRVHDALITDVCVREGLTTSSKERRLIGRCWPFSLGYIISTMNEEERDERIRRLEARVEELLSQQLAIYDIVKRDHRAIEGLQQAALVTLQATRPRSRSPLTR